MTKKRKKKEHDPLASVPPETRAEIERAFAALTEDAESHRASAKEWQQLKPWLDQATEAGKTLPEILQDFAATEHYLREQPVDAMFTLCDKLGVDAHAMARALIEIGEGEAKPAPLDKEKLLPAIHARLDQAAQERDALDAIDHFKEQHPRFAELEPVIAGLLEKEIATDLPDAYAKAELLKPVRLPPRAPAHNNKTAAQTRAIPAVHPAPTLDADHPRKAKLSITGAPPSGSDPATRKVPATTRDAVEKAFAQLGL
jgi:hypothetical protein